MRFLYLSIAAEELQIQRRRTKGYYTESTSLLLSFKKLIPLVNIKNLQYFGDLQIGSPKKKVSVIFDTGSADFWLPQKILETDPSRTSKKTSRLPKTMRTLWRSHAQVGPDPHLRMVRKRLQKTMETLWGSRTSKTMETFGPDPRPTQLRLSSDSTPTQPRLNSDSTPIQACWNFD